MQAQLFEIDAGPSQAQATPAPAARRQRALPTEYRANGGNAVGTAGPQEEKVDPPTAADGSGRPYHSEGDSLTFWGAVRWDRDARLAEAEAEVEAGAGVEAVRERLTRAFWDALTVYRRDEAGRQRHGYHRESKRLHLVAQKALRAFNRAYPDPDRFDPEGYPVRNSNPRSDA